MKTIGITGGSGSGKTTFLQVIAKRGGCIIDCDALYHQLLRENQTMLAEIDARFPNTVENGVLNRKKLGVQVFGDPAALLDLNAITHPYVIRAVHEILQNSQADLAAIDAIGLFDSKLDQICDTTVCITAPQKVRIERLMQRDHISEEAAKNRLAAQHSDEAFIRLCKHTIVNDGSKEQLIQRCNALLDTL